MLLRASIYETRGPTDVDFATYAVTRGVTFSPIYQVSAKTSLQRTVAFSQLRYLGESLSTVVGEKQQYDYWTAGVSGCTRLRVSPISTRASRTTGAPRTVASVITRQ